LYEKTAVRGLIIGLFARALYGTFWGFCGLSLPGWILARLIR
jgi:hypothetical protein